MKRNSCKRTQRIKSLFLSKRKNAQNVKIIKFDKRLHRNVSCPNLTRNLTCFCETLPSKVKKTSSSLHCQMKNRNFLSDKSLNNLILPNYLKRSLSTSIVTLTKCPCAPCSCLPPPCNTPPKCIQYMTGYYYYPYGTWFCGPYHVSTGACGPCSGPIKPGGPCGPSPPCPCGPCGPCGPLCCCGVTLDGGNQQPNNAFSSNNQWPMFYTYNPYMQYYYNPNNYAYQNQYAQYNAENAHFPYNVPNPQTLDQTKKQYSQTQIQDSSTKSSISWPPPDEPKVSTLNQTAPLIPNPSVSQPAKNPFSKMPYSPPPFPYDSKSTLSKTNPFTKPKTNARTMLPPNLGGICYYTTKYISRNKGNNIKIKTRKNMNTNIKGFSAEKLKSKRKFNKNDWNIFEGK